tara:strand:- start:152 stop:322 length:171 start_codon:yes stop_codon:yes gene_type:complete
MRKLVLIIIILSSCTIQNKDNVSTQKLNFSTNMKLEDFRLQLENYAKNSSYPNIDE